MRAISLTLLFILVSSLEKVGGEKQTDNEFTIGVSNPFETLVNVDRTVKRLYEGFLHLIRSICSPSAPSEHIFYQIVFHQVVLKFSEIVVDACHQYLVLKEENSKLTNALIE